MEKLSTKIWLAFLRGLVYPKRVLVWVWNKTVILFDWAGNKYRQGIGFYIYKFTFLLKKKISEIVSPWGSKAEGFWGQRWVLQLFGLLVGLGIMLPHSSLWSNNGIEIPGRQTLLYRLVGPGDQNFDLEEITVQASNLTPDRTSRNWHEGAVVASPGITQGQLIIPDDGIARQSLGGTAFVKPIILPGTELAKGRTGSASDNTGRSEIAIYEVQPGDVLGAIARRFGVSVSSILSANNLTLRSYIRPGDKLKILPIDGVIHVVKKGDTLSKIAKFYKAKTEDIVVFNKITADTPLTAGIELIVPHGVKPTPIIQQTQTRRFTVLEQIVAPPNSSDSPTVAGYVWPTAVRRITQYYGLRHTGVDIAGPIGTPVYAVRSGTVIKSQCGWNGGYGCYIIIDHGGGIQSLYGHNSQLLVAVGDEVIQGQTISLMGSTGRSTGPHCHFEIRSKGRRANPLQYIR